MILPIPISFIVGFVASLIVFLVGFNYIGVEVNFNLGLFIILFSLGIGGLIKMRKKWHQGQLPMFLGLLMIIAGAVLFYGDMEYKTKNSETGELELKDRWWNLTSKQDGIFILLLIFGLITLIAGMKQSFSSAYFWGSVKNR